MKDLTQLMNDFPDTESIQYLSASEQQDIGAEPVQLSHEQVDTLLNELDYNCTHCFE